MPPSTIQPDPARFVLALSHVNIVVPDLEEATEFYRRTLGFEQAFNADVNGEPAAMDYPDVTLETFARSAGFLDGRVRLDVRFLKHPTACLYLELMRYEEPLGDQKIDVVATNDLGGPRHVALEVSDANAVFDFLREQPGVRMINESPEYGPPEFLEPFPIKFFYWIDPYGVQWEMEQGRPLGDMRGIVG